MPTPLNKKTLLNNMFICISCISGLEDKSMFAEIPLALSENSEFKKPSA